MSYIALLFCVRGYVQILLCCAKGRERAKIILFLYTAIYFSSMCSCNVQYTNFQSSFLNVQESSLFLDECLLHDVRDSSLGEAYIQDFFVVLALCNTVVVSKKSHEQEGQ